MHQYLLLTLFIYDSLGYGAGAGVPNGYGAKPNSNGTLFFIVSVHVYKMFTTEHFADDNLHLMQI